MQQASYCY